MKLIEQEFDFESDKFHDECGVFGVYSKSPKNNVALLTYYGLFALQHRGQESAGIAVSTSKGIVNHKALGYVGDIFTKSVLEKLSKNNPKIAIGHVRYSTAGSKTVQNAQPFVVNSKIGKIAIVHNGNLVNTDQLRKKYVKEGIKFVSTVDSELIANIIANNLKTCKTIESAIIATTKEIKGAYSLIVSTKDKMIGLRDPHGIRPLCLGKQPDGTLILSSESCAFSSTGAKFVQDIKKGEIITISKNKIFAKTYINVPKRSCIFEYVYFALDLILQLMESIVILQELSKVNFYTKNIH